jgi:hypothetical protein
MVYCTQYFGFLVFFCPLIIVRDHSVSEKDLFAYEVKTEKAQTQASSKRNQLLYISPSFHLRTKQIQFLLMSSVRNTRG